MRMVVLSGFEPESPAPKAGMIDHYTTGLFGLEIDSSYYNLFPKRYVDLQSVTSTSTNVPRGMSSLITTGL